jgi:hypothetical protein
MSVYPEVRVYADPFEGLTVQLTELRGLIKIVPPLIEADRERRWTEIGERPSDGEDGDVIDAYGAEAGPQEGWGFADSAVRSVSQPSSSHGRSSELLKSARRLTRPVAIRVRHSFRGASRSRLHLEGGQCLGRSPGF